MTVLAHFLLILGLVSQCVEVDSVGTPFLGPSLCSPSEYFDLNLMQCQPCGLNQISTENRMDCICQPGFLQNSSALAERKCTQCQNGQVISSQNFCINCPSGAMLTQDVACECQTGAIAVDTKESGSIQTPANLNRRRCVICDIGYVPNEKKDKCISCTLPTLRFESIAACIVQASKWSQCNGIVGVTLPEYCLTVDSNINGAMPSLARIEVMSKPVVSPYFVEHFRLEISYTQCRHYGKSSACSLAKNLCALKGSSAGLAIDDNSRLACNPIGTAEQSLFISDTAVETKLPPISFVTIRSREIESAAGNIYSYLDLRAAAFNINGTFRGWRNATDGFLQLCHNKHRFADAWLGFGVNYALTCRLTVGELLRNFETTYYQLYIVFPSKDERTGQGTTNKFIVPVKMTSPSGTEGSRWLSRFFITDSISLKKSSTVSEGPKDNVLRFASKITLRIRVNGTDAILPPQLFITYSDVYTANENAEVAIEFAVSYEASGATFDDIVKMLLIALIGVGFYVGIKLYGWFQRRGGDCDQAACLLPTMMLVVAGTGNILTIVLLGVSIWYLIAYKFQNFAIFMLPSKDEGEKAFLIVAVVALICKLMHCLQLVIQQSTIDIFFLDWEQPKLSQVVSLSGSGSASGPPATPSGATGTVQRGSTIRSQPRGSIAPEAKPPVKEQLHPVSVWRTFFIGNEWNELQIIRRTNPAVQLLAVMALIEFIGLGNLATGDPYIDLEHSSSKYHSEYRWVLRYGITGCMYVAFALAQWLFFLFIYERWVADAARNFVDLCAISNISVFILAEQRHGYYIHGRLLNGHADTSQKELADFLTAEARDESPKGGLFTGSAQRTYEIMVPLRIRTTIDAYILQMKQATGPKQRSARGNPEHSTTDYKNLAAAQEALKYFISNEVEKNGQNGSAVLRTKKTFIENMFDIECVRSPDGMIFYEDDGRAFEDVLLLGHELTLVMFELLLFCLIDMVTFDATLAGLVTYAAGQLLITLRANFGEKNVALKTGVDERFLI